MDERAVRLGRPADGRKHRRVTRAARVLGLRFRRRTRRRERRRSQVGGRRGEFSHRAANRRSFDEQLSARLVHGAQVEVLAGGSSRGARAGGCVVERGGVEYVAGKEVDADAKANVERAERVD